MGSPKPFLSPESPGRRPEGGRRLSAPIPVSPTLLWAYSVRPYTSLWDIASEGRNEFIHASEAAHRAAATRDLYKVPLQKLGQDIVPFARRFQEKIHHLAHGPLTPLSLGDIVDPLPDLLGCVAGCG